MGSPGATTQVDFGSLEEVIVNGMNGGAGKMSVRMFFDGRRRIIETRMPPGSSIGDHLQTTGDDVNFVVEGTGTAFCDGTEETLRPGTCHVCPRGSRHSIINTGATELVLWTVIVYEVEREGDARHPTDPEENRSIRQGISADELVER